MASFKSAVRACEAISKPVCMAGAWPFQVYVRCSCGSCCTAACCDDPHSKLPTTVCVGVRICCLSAAHALGGDQLVRRGLATDGISDAVV